MTDEMSEERLAEIEQRYAKADDVVYVTWGKPQVDASDDIERLLDEVCRLREENVALRADLASIGQAAAAYLARTVSDQESQDLAEAIRTLATALAPKDPQP